MKKISIPDYWVPSELKGLLPIHPTRGADVTWRKPVQHAGPRYFIVGEAAAVLDPSFSHGILRGLMSGMKAAHEILRVIKDHFSLGFNERLFYFSFTYVTN